MSFTEKVFQSMSAKEIRDYHIEVLKLWKRLGVGEFMVKKKMKSAEKKK